jgi:REP element-mobilizing transposase RayT
MPQSLAQIYLHLVWSTKNRHPFLQDQQVREDLWGYMQGICENLDCPSLRIGGLADHVHILCRFGRSISVADLVRDVKRDSTTWLKEQFPLLSEFHWQAGYGAFSISPGHVPGLKDYIANQEQRHRENRETYQDEFRRLCRKYGVAIDERYVWD